MPASTLDQLPPRPSKTAQRLASDAHDRIAERLRDFTGEQLEVALAESPEPLTLPREALVLLRDILAAMATGKPVTIVPLAMELTTQAAADQLGCSRPHLVKLLESGEIPFTKVGRHRRVKYEDLVRYQTELKRKQRRTLAAIMADDEVSGLYDEADGTE